MPKVMLSVIMLNVIILITVAPQKRHSAECCVT